MDLDRLPTRNLGRDDRIISAHGVETRFPYLSLKVVRHVASRISIDDKIGPAVQARLPAFAAEGPAQAPLLGDKIVLRAACRRYGLISASERKKRAMQFGTRSARMEVDGEMVTRGMGQRKVQ